MSVYVSTTYLGDGSDIQEAIDELKTKRITNIELGSNHHQLQIKNLVLDSGSQYIAHNYFPPKDPNFVLNIASQSNKVQDQSVKFIKNTIKLCQRLDIRFYTIHPGFLGDVTLSKERREPRNFDFRFAKNAFNKKRQTVVQTTVQTIRDIYKFAKKYDVQLLIENEGSKTSPDFVIFDNPVELDMLKKAVGESFKFNFNLAHATLAGIDLKDSKTFNYFYKNSEFFEVSEIQGIYDSHLPIFLNKGQISLLIKRYSRYFANKNIILEYRNTNIKEVNRSYIVAKKLLNPLPPPV